MGVLTRTQMNDEVASILTRSDFTTSIDLRLSWAYEEVAEAKYWKVHQIEDKTTTLVASTQDYAIPSTLRTVETIVMVDESTTPDTFYRLNPEDLAEFQELGRNLTAETGTPILWTMLGNQIRLYNIPATAFAGFKLYIIGKKKISYFTLDSSTTDLDQKLDRAIIYKAAQICYNDLMEEGEEAVRYQRLAEQAINDAYSDELAYSTL